MIQRTEKQVICASCDIACQLIAKVEDGRVVRVRSSRKKSQRENICIKGIYAPQNFASPHRLLHPLRRVGERGSGQWEQVSWDVAMGEIAERLGKVIDRYGPEAWAVATSQWNTSVDHGLGRRLMNLVGSPNWISGVALCAGNTAAINRMTYGWFPQPDYAATRCIALFGHNPKKHSWTPVYNRIMAARARGAKLIVLDPRRSEMAERADIWLPLNVGTDAAMAMGWVRTIVEEGLYDADFVRDWTVGFTDLKQRLEEYPLERVSAITGVPTEQIRAAARMYAIETPGVIPWTPITDQQINSTSAIRLHCILRALTGNLDVQGGETLQGFNRIAISESEIELHEALSQSQRDKQLGSDRWPAFTYRGTAALEEPTERVWGLPYANLIGGSYMAVPGAVFEAMADGNPYPVKALISLGNNTLLGFTNMARIEAALRNLDLLVVHEHIKTPTAQLADFILPGDTWLERPLLYDTMTWASAYAISDKASEPAGECRSVFDFWCDLARRMGHADSFPWGSIEEFYDWRLQPSGLDWASFSDKFRVHAARPEYRKYERTGFATPSGKVELASSMLADLGFDPLPYYREPPAHPEGFPLTLFMGVRDDGFFQTAHRHVPELRRMHPEPKTFLNAQTAERFDLGEGDWVAISTPEGTMHAIVEIRTDMPDGLVRVPHGWWKPETAEGPALSGARAHSDGNVTLDDEAWRDREQGIPHLKGIPCRIVGTEAPALAMQQPHHA